MNSLYYFTLPVLVLLLAACQSEGKNPPALSNGEMTFIDTASYQPPYVHVVLTPDELNAQNTSQGGYGQIMSPPMNRTEAQILTRSYWVYEFYHDINGSIPQRVNGKGQWFRFSDDGSFVGGHWDRQTHSGVWYLLYDGDHRYLTIDSNVDRLDGKWDIQAVGTEEDVMGWVRVSDFGMPLKNPIHGKLIELYNMPTKQQFGVN